MRAFKTPKKSIGALDAEASGALIAAAADIALVVDEEGTICDVAFHADDLARDLVDEGNWLGRAWRDTVNDDSRAKVDALIASATGASGETMRPRHVNHPSPVGPDVPILYSAVRIGTRGRLVAFGRDLRAVSALQQRLVDAQQSMERDYTRLRDVERRYNLLFQTIDPVLVLDAASLSVTEANAAASQLFDATDAAPLRGRTVAALFDPASLAGLHRLLAGVRATGRAEDATATLPGGRVVRASASVFREEQAWLFLLRLSLAANDSNPPPVERLNTAAARLLEFARHAPDAFVVAGPDMRVVTINTAFLDMIQMTSEYDVLGQAMDRWVGRPGVDLDVLVANVRQRGSVRLFSTGVVGEQGQRTDVEISAVAMINAGAPGFGFAIRDIGRRMAPPTTERAEARARPESAAHALPRSVEQLTELIGRVSLKEMVRESTDVIERLCIEAALELTGDNRASAAEMLGLSRQSFYVKLRRYGLGDLGPDMPDGEP